MPLYTILCPTHGTEVVGASMSEAGWSMLCPKCSTMCPRMVESFQFAQDNLRLYEDGAGGKFSHALGTDMPESRKQRDRMAKAKGVEFTTKAEFLADNPQAAEAVAYREHVDAGGERFEIKPKATSGWVPTSNVTH